MTDTITRNSSPTVAIANLVFVESYDVAYPVENVLHPQLNGEGHTVTYRPSRLRTGTLALIFATPAAAWAAIAILRTAYTFTLTADVTELSMTFVVAPGSLTPRHAEKGTPVWIVEVPVQEVTP